MSRLKGYGGVVSLFGSENPPHCLKKQSRYSGDPWVPGEIPTRHGTCNTVYAALDDPKQPWGEFMGVQTPENSFGRGYSPVNIVDEEGRETDIKKSGGKGYSALPLSGKRK